MKDATAVSRLERTVASLEILVGRLERFAGSSLSLPDSPASQLASGEPPPLSIEDTIKEIDAYTKKRLEEIEYERETKKEYALGD